MPHTMTFDGSYNIGVQAHGDGITVDVNLPHLYLVRKHVRRHEPTELLDLLDPEFRAIPLIGRDEQRRNLRGWLTSGAPISVRCLVGRAGSGKTRLALELCEEAEAVGWFAGFASQREVGRFLSQQNLAGWRWPKPTLVVIDYAAASARRLRNWLAELADNPGDPARPLRLLLLERHADAQLGWWPEIAGGGGFGGRRVRRLFDPAEPVPLPSIADVEERRAMLAEVMASASAIIGRAESLRPPASGERPDFDQRLANRSLEFEPLYLLMAGLVAVHHGVGGLLAWNRTDLATELAGRELDRLARLGGGDRSRQQFFKHMAACITLMGGCRRDDVERVIAEEQAALGYRTVGDPPEIAGRLEDGMGAADADGPVAIRPDLIGEAAMLTALAPRNAERQNALIGRAYGRAPRATVTVVIRTAQDYADAHNHPSLAWLDHLVRRTGDDLGALLSIAAQLPERTINLRKAAAVIQEAVVTRLRGGLSQDADEGYRGLLGGALNDLALRLSDVGQREDALAAVAEATGLYRKLAASHPDAFRPYLATSLNSLATMLSDLGRRKAALATAEEAVALRRKLAASYPDAFGPDLAMALCNLAGFLRRLNRHEEALGAAAEAEGLYRELAGSRWDVFRPGLAMTLNNLAAILGGLGRWEAAHAAAAEAAGFCRELAAARPDAFRPDLAAALNNLAKSLSDLGRSEEAHAAAAEAVELCRELAGARPDAFRPDLTRALNNLARSLSDLGRRDEALCAATEAAGLYRRLAGSRPDAFQLSLATTLTNLATYLNNLRRWEEAREIAAEAVTIQRELAVSHPEVFRSELAMALNNLASSLNKLDRWEEALRAATEAVTIRRQLAASHPDAFQFDLAMSLGNLARSLNGMCRWEDAMEAAAEAEELYRKLLASRPNVIRYEMAGVLTCAVRSCSGLARWEEALGPAAEAVGLCRDLAASHPDAFRPELAGTLHNLATVLSRLRRWEEAYSAAAEAVALYHGLAAARPDAFRPDLAVSLAELANCLEAVGRDDEALGTNGDAVATLSEPFCALPQAFAHWMGPMVRQYLERCKRLGREPDEELLAPIVEVFQRMQGQQDDGSAV